MGTSFKFRGNRRIRLPCKRLSRGLNIANILHINCNKSHSRVFFSSSVLFLINYWNSCSIRRGLFDMNSIFHDPVSIHTPLPTSFPGFSPTHPYGARDGTGRREPWDEVAPFPISFPPKHPLSYSFSPKYLVSKYTLIGPFCLDTSLLTFQCLNIPYHINLPNILYPYNFSLKYPSNLL